MHRVVQTNRQELHAHSLVSFPHLITQGGCCTQLQIYRWEAPGSEPIGLGIESENVESNEMMEAALERTGDMQISLLLQETMRGAIRERTRKYSTNTGSQVIG